MTADQRCLHLLEPLASGQWKVIGTWDVSELSHTRAMLALQEIDEPATAVDLLSLLTRIAPASERR